MSSGLFEGGEGADSIHVADLVKSTVKGEAGDDYFSATGAVTAGVLYGNKGNDSIEIVGAATSSSVYGGGGNDSVTIKGVANTLTYEGGLGATHQAR